MKSFDDIPLGYTYDDKGNEITFRDATGYAWERTYDDKGNELSFQDSYGYAWECTRDVAGKVLTYKNSDSYAWERTYDDKGNKLTFKDSHGHSWEKTYDAQGRELTIKDAHGHWITLAQSAAHALRYNAETKMYWAGCKKLNAKDALKYWGMEAIMKNELDIKSNK